MEDTQMAYSNKRQSAPQTHIQVLSGALVRKVALSYYGTLDKTVKRFVDFRTNHQTTSKVGGSGNVGSMDQSACELGDAALPLIFEQLLKVRVEGKPLKVTTPLSFVAKAKHMGFVVFGCSVEISGVEKSFTLRSFVKNGIAQFGAQQGPKKSGPYCDDITTVIKSLFDKKDLAVFDDTNTELSLSVSDNYRPHAYGKVKIEQYLMPEETPVEILSYIQENYTSLMTNESCQLEDVQRYMQNEVVLKLLLAASEATAWLKTNNFKILNTSLWYSKEGIKNVKITIRIGRKIQSIMIQCIQGVVRFGMVERAAKAANGKRLPAVKIDSPESVSELFVVKDESTQEPDQESLDQLETEGLSSDTTENANASVG
jgi:hypothetical protein